MLPDNEESNHVDGASVLSFVAVDKVKFENIKRKYVCDPANPSCIMVEYVLDKEVRPSTRDWLGLFPRGWNDLLQNVAFEYIVGRVFNEQERRWKVSMSLKFVKEDLYHPEFQFVFVSSDLQVLGTSSYFRFYKSEADAQRFSGKISKSDIQLVEKIHISETNIKPVTQRGNKLARVGETYQERYGFNPFPARSVCSDTSLLWNRNGLYKPNCNNCQRLPEIMALQHGLFQEVKNLAESKRDLEDQLKVAQHNLELSVAAQKKLRLVAEYEKRERMTFQSIATSFLSQMSEGATVRATNGVLEPPFSQISTNFRAHQRYMYPYYPVMPWWWHAPIANFQVVVQPMHRPPVHSVLYNSLVQRRPKLGTSCAMASRYTELKAIIGAQNEKIRKMAMKMAQMQAMLDNSTTVETAVLEAKTECIKVTTADPITAEPCDLNNNC